MQEEALRRILDLPTAKEIEAATRLAKRMLDG
jgi:hypothetical protein